MTWATNPDGVLASGWLTSAYPGLGILGSAIPTSGDNGGSPVLNDGINANREYYWKILTTPAAGTFLPYEDLTFDFNDAPDGPDSFSYRLYEDGIDSGTATVTLQVGPNHALITATTAGAHGSLSAALGGVSCAISALASNVSGAFAVSGNISTALFNAVTAGSTGSYGAHNASAICFYNAVTQPSVFSGQAVGVLDQTLNIHPLFIVKAHPSDTPVAMFKDPEEIITVTFDFTGVATEISDPVVTVGQSLLWDPDISQMISGALQVSGLCVLQRFIGGMPGNKCTVRCVVNDEDGERFVAANALHIGTAGNDVQ